MKYWQDFWWLLEYDINGCSCGRACSDGRAFGQAFDGRVAFGQALLYALRGDCLLTQAFEVVLTSPPHPLASLALPRLIEWAVCNQLVEQTGKVPGRWPVRLKAIISPIAVDWMLCMLGREFSHLFLSVYFFILPCFFVVVVLCNTSCTLACSFNSVLYVLPFSYFINFSWIAMNKLVSPSCHSVFALSLPTSW